MSRTAAIAGGALVLVALSIFGWKVIGLGLPLLPSDTRGLWRVELEVDVRGSGSRGSVRAALPSNEPGQSVSDERLEADRLLFTIRTEDGQRVGIWRGPVTGVHRLRHAFRVQLAPYRTPLPRETPRAPPAEVASRFGGPAPGIPSDAGEVAALLDALRVTEERDPRDRLRSVFSFVADEVALVESESDDALLTLAAREGSAAGKERLLVTLLRGAGVPARTVGGLGLRAGRDVRPTLWAEAWLGDGWIPLSASRGFFAERPDDLVALYRGGLRHVEATQVEAWSARVRALREPLHPDELAALMVPPNRALAALSLYRVPVATQSALRVLLVIPLGALAIALFRNVIGFPAFGTFLPVLLALAMRQSRLGPGLVMVASVIVVGVAARTTMDRLHLLLVPRVCILLCVVVLGIVAFGVTGRGIGEEALFGGVLLPIVILAMLIERFSIAMAEEGLRPALVKLGWTTLIAVCVYPLFRSEVLQHLMFGFPELVLAVMGTLVWIGGYTGFRLLELVRFRVLARQIGEEPS